MSHTPGPWKVTDCWSQCYGDSHAIQGETDEEMADNAHLIAAAPDLLEACKEFVRKCESGEAQSKGSYAQMVAAIAKAEPNAA